MLRPLYGSLPKVVAALFCWWRLFLATASCIFCWGLVWGAAIPSICCMEWEWGVSVLPIAVVKYVTRLSPLLCGWLGCGPSYSAVVWLGAAPLGWALRVQPPLLLLWWPLGCGPSSCCDELVGCNPFNCCEGWQWCSFSLWLLCKLTVVQPLSI